MSKHLKICAKIISYLLLFALITGILLYNGKDIIALFKKVNIVLIGISMLLQIPMIACGGLAFKILCTALGIEIRWQDWAGLSFIANFLNQLLPYRPGVGFRYLYMRQHYHMKTSQFFHVMFIYLLLTLLVSCLFTLFGWLMTDIPNNFNIMVLCALGFSLGMIVAFILLKKQKFLINASMHKTQEQSLAAKLMHAFFTLINNPAALLGATLSLLCVNLFTAAIFYFVFMSTGSPLPLGDCFFLVGIVVLAMIIPITPGNIGVLETLVGTLTQALYHDFSLGFGVTALFRASQWLPSMLLGTGFSLFLVGSLIPKFKPLQLGPRQTVD
ncbi:MAG: flippase-like domain-containing protein [Proteobacteria bacterium]|nr:flippase-like domain-containing protein [Pseudomonadota bacterium]